MAGRIEPRASPPRSASAASAVLPACLGFVAGAAFWHFVGFWEFVGQVVLNGPEQSAEQRVVQPQPEQSELVYRLATASTAVSGCARLLLDRGSWRTLLLPCDPESAAVTSGEAAARGDLVNATRASAAAPPPVWTADAEGPN